MKLVVVGAGGHARSILEAVRAAGEHEAVACTDPRPELAGKDLDGVPIVGDDSRLAELLESGAGAACIGLGGAANNRPRMALFDRILGAGFELPAIIHPAAIVASNARIGRGCVVLAAAVVGPGASLADNVVVNTGAVVEHDCIIEAHVHVATGALLGGEVVCERLSHIGIGASVLNGLRIGAGAVVGGGSAVIRDVAPETTVVGCPAAPLRESR
jgi:UDP-perosamine 4-acetyltransferase